LQNSYPQFQVQNADILALVVEPQSRVQTLVENYGYSYPVLADADHVASDAFGVYNLLSDNRAAPSVFVIDESGLVIWAYVGQHTYDRPATQTILDQLP